MSENLATFDGLPTPRLLSLYRTWSCCGAGLIITGNVMIEDHRLCEVGNVVLTDKSPLEPFQEWAQAAKSNKSKVWMQICHPGPRQVWTPFCKPVSVSERVVKRNREWYSSTKEVSEIEIDRIIAAFARTAELARTSGFEGVQINAGHGFLISQFFAEKTNLRTDRWGGTLEKRFEFLFEIIRAVRRVNGSTFPLSVKICSGDFMRADLSDDDNQKILSRLLAQEIDLLEINGGHYRREPAKSSSFNKLTEEREQYFARFVESAVTQRRDRALMVTGGLHNIDVMNYALGEGIDLIGVARSIALNPLFCASILKGDSQTDIQPPVLGIPYLDYLLSVKYWPGAQLRRVSEGFQPSVSLSPVVVLLRLAFTYLHFWTWVIYRYLKKDR